MADPYKTGPGAVRRVRRPCRLSEDTHEGRQRCRRSVGAAGRGTPEEWQTARDGLLVKETRATRGLDALAAERRRLPVVEFSTGYGFDGPHGCVDLLEGCE
jgi:Bacterial protein of unknown function (DUF899)